jgi:hypothetical protein
VSSAGGGGGPSSHPVGASTPGGWGHRSITPTATGHGWVHRATTPVGGPTGGFTLTSPMRAAPSPGTGVPPSPSPGRSLCRTPLAHREAPGPSSDYWAASGRHHDGAVTPGASGVGVGAGVGPAGASVTPGLSLPVPLNSLHSPLPLPGSPEGQALRHANPAVRQHSGAVVLSNQTGPVLATRYLPGRLTRATSASGRRPQPGNEGRPGSSPSGRGRGGPGGAVGARGDGSASLSGPLGAGGDAPTVAPACAPGPASAYGSAPHVFSPLAFGSTLAPTAAVVTPAAAAAPGLHSVLAPAARQWDPLSPVAATGSDTGAEAQR